MHSQRSGQQGEIWGLTFLEAFMNIEWNLFLSQIVAGHNFLLEYSFCDPLQTCPAEFKYTVQTTI